MTYKGGGAIVIVKKFGGTSVGSTERIEAVASRVAASKAAGESPIVVVSAMSGETNRLAALAARIDPENRGMAYDMLLASGEQVSISLLAMALQKKGLKAEPLLAHQIGIQTDAMPSKARIQSINVEKLNELVGKEVVPVIAGFQGVTGGFQITTLGRGGSDTTAVAMAAALKCPCEIYTDVPAVCTADPRLVDGVSEIGQVSFEEMMEMASLGSKILQIRCVELAAKYNVPIHVRSSLEEREGTWIVPEEESMEKPVVSAVAHDEATTVFKLFPVPYGASFLSKLFTSLAEKGVVVDIITQSQNEEGQRLAFSISDEDLPLAEALLKEILPSDVNVDKLQDVSKISVIGVGMRNHPGVAARFFEALAKEEIGLHIVTTSEIKISAVIDRGRLKTAAGALHSEFHLGGQDA